MYPVSKLKGSSFAYAVCPRLVRRLVVAGARTCSGYIREGVQSWGSRPARQNVEQGDSGGSGSGTAGPLPNTRDIKGSQQIAETESQHEGLTEQRDESQSHSKGHTMRMFSWECAEQHSCLLFLVHFVRHIHIVTWMYGRRRHPWQKFADFIMCSEHSASQHTGELPGDISKPSSRM